MRLNALKLWSIFILLKSFSIKFGIKSCVSINKRVLKQLNPPDNGFSKIPTRQLLVGRARIYFDCSLCMQPLSLLAELIFAGLINFTELIFVAFRFFNYRSLLY